MEFSRPYLMETKTGFGMNIVYCIGEPLILIEKEREKERVSEKETHIHTHRNREGRERERLCEKRER